MSLKGPEENFVAGSAPWIGLEHVPKNVESSLKTFLNKLSKYEQRDIYLTRRYNYAKPTTKLTIKVTDPSIVDSVFKENAFKEYKFSKSSKGITTKGNVSVELLYSSGLRGSGRLNKVGDKKNTPTNEQQELGTIFYFQRMLSDNKPPTLDEMTKEIKFDFDAEWYHNYKEQWNAFSSQYSTLTKFKQANLYLDSERNDSNALFETARKLGLKDTKDNWNPADIWFMRTSKGQVIAATKEMTTLAEFNAWIKKMFNEQEIVGISLKKISKNKKGKFEIVNEKNTLPDVNIKGSSVIFSPFNQTNFIFKTSGNVNGFNIRVGAKAKSITNERDINLFSEGRMESSSVQLGAVSAELINNTMMDNGYNKKLDRTKIFANPLKYIEETLPRIKRNPIVKYVDAPTPTTEVGMKIAAYMVYFMDFYLSLTPDQLRQFYYSASKMNDFSSIHGKIS